MAKKISHTPAPWTIAPNGYVVMGDQSTDLCASVASPVKATYNEAKANLHLISAAPDLLAALAGLLAIVNVRIDDPRIEQFDAARAAIAKATGAA